VIRAVRGFELRGLSGVCYARGSVHGRLRFESR
jgi:hypothetical protein